MKKTYIFPNEKVIELGIEGRLLDNSVQGEVPEIDKQDEEDATARSGGSIWGEW